MLGRKKKARFCKLLYPSHVHWFSLSDICLWLGSTATSIDISSPGVICAHSCFTHHKLHHRYYQKNFCVLIPVADWVFGTTITEASIERSSGYSALDLNALRAVLGTRQLPPLPAAFPNPILPVHLNFQYTR